MNGVIEVLVYTLGLSFFIAVIYRLLTKPEEMRRIKENMKQVNEKVKKAQKSGSTEEVNKLTSEMLKGSQEQFRQSMKPMMASMIIFFVFLGWVGAQFAELVVRLPFYIPFVGMECGWFMWYIIITLPATFLFRRLLGVE